MITTLGITQIWEKKYKMKKPSSPTLLNNAFLSGEFSYIFSLKNMVLTHMHKGFLFKNFPILLDLPKRQELKS
jgi:hypothetical protein